MIGTFFETLFGAWCWIFVVFPFRSYLFKFEGIVRQLCNVVDGFKFMGEVKSVFENLKRFEVSRRKAFETLYNLWTIPKDNLTFL